MQLYVYFHNPFLKVTNTLEKKARKTRKTESSTMGSVSTRIWPRNFEDDQYGTPTAFNRRHRLQCDPRSPTEEICRTPIMVEDTPNFLQYLKELDPRSPPYGFQRTPLLGTQVHDTVDPRSPSCDIARTPVDNMKHEFPEHNVVEKTELKIPEEEKECETFQRENERAKEKVTFNSLNQRRPKQLFMEEFVRPRTPLAVTNGSNVMRSRATSKQATADTHLGSPRKGPAWPTDDKENSPHLLLTTM